MALKNYTSGVTESQLVQELRAEIDRLTNEVKDKNEAINIVIICVCKNLNLIDIKAKWPFLYDDWESQTCIPDNQLVDFLIWMLEKALKGGD
jgi:hypothetical protein